MARARWWKFYFYFALVLTASSTTVSLWGDDEIHHVWWEWIYIPLYVLQAVALFGFVYCRRIVNPTFWQAFFVITAAYEIWNAYEMVEIWAPLSTPIVSTIVLALVYSVQVPLWFGTFLYAFRSPELWNAKT